MSFEPTKLTVRAYQSARGTYSFYVEISGTDQAEVWDSVAENLEYLRLHFPPNAKQEREDVVG